MTLTINQILGVEQLLIGLVNEKMPMRLAYKLHKLTVEIQKEKEFYSKEMAKLISSYAEKKEDDSYLLTESGNGVIIKEGMKNEFESKIDELLSTEVFISDTKINPEDLEKFNFTILEMNLLSLFLE